MKNVKLMAEVEIDPYSLLSSLDYDEALEFISSIDLAFADVGFTENLIIRLIKSIKSDISTEEWEPYQNLLNSIENEIQN